MVYKRRPTCTGESPPVIAKADRQIACGSAEAKAQFSFSPGFRNLNHGSFGTYPTALRSVLRSFQEDAECHPDIFIRFEYPKLLDQSRRAVAQLINAPVDDCVLVQNATTAFNAVLRNLTFDSGDVIVYNSIIYGACEKTIIYITETTPAQSMRINLTLPLSNQEICALYEAAFKSIIAAGNRPRVAVFDTVSSAPGVRMPYEQLTKLCRNYRVLSCIDGAHGVGQIPLDITALDPDFFLSNCHKWLHVPRACCILYVPQRNQDAMRSTLPTSHGFEPRPTPGTSVIVNPLPVSMKPHFINNFEFVGTLDSTPYLCIPAALAWRQQLTWNGLDGEAAIHAYLTHLARRAGDATRRILGTEVLENAEISLQDCAFSNVRLPLTFKEHAGSDLATAVKIGQWISQVLADEHNTFIAIVWHADKWWARLSAQVYLDEGDFKWAGTVLKEVCARARAGEWKSAA